MNKKDCEHIGYLLSTYRVSSEFLQGIFDMDKRIKPEYELFEEVQGRSEEIDAMAHKLMLEANGPGWAFKKKEFLTATFGECLEKAKKYYGLI